MLEANRRLKKCYSMDGEPAFVKNYNNMEIIYKTCPGNIRQISTDFIFELFAQYDKGVNILEDPFSNWPVKLTQGFSTIDDLRKSYAEKKRKEEEKLNGRRSLGKNHNRRQ